MLESVEDAVQVPTKEALSLNGSPSNTSSSSLEIFVAENVSRGAILSEYTEASHAPTMLPQVPRVDRFVLHKTSPGGLSGNA